MQDLTLYVISRSPEILEKFEEIHSIILPLIQIPSCHNAGLSNIIIIIVNNQLLSLTSIILTININITTNLNF